MPETACPWGSLLISVEEGEQSAPAAPEPEAKAPVPAPKEEPEPTPVAAPPESNASCTQTHLPPRPTAIPFPRAPSTRRFARELGVDLTQIAGSGPGGRISQDDVKAAVRDRQTGGFAPTTPVELPDFSRWGGNIERQPLSKVRQIIAKNMSQAWQQVAHVTQFDRADVTDLEAFRQRNKEKAEALGAKLTPTVLALKAIITALKTFPQFNASLRRGVQ